MLFMEKRVSNSLKVLPGSGTETVNLPFIPEYIKVKFLDVNLNKSIDTLTYDLLFTGNPALPYQLVINWSVTGGKSRRFKYIAAKLSSFHGGNK